MIPRIQSRLAVALTALLCLWTSSSAQFVQYDDFSLARIQTIAGRPNNPGYRDGLMLNGEVQLSSPVGVHADFFLNITLIADSGNNAVRAVSTVTSRSETVFTLPPGCGLAAVAAGRKLDRIYAACARAVYHGVQRVVGSTGPPSGAVFVGALALPSSADPNAFSTDGSYYGTAFLEITAMVHDSPDQVLYVCDGGAGAIVTIMTEVNAVTHIAGSVQMRNITDAVSGLSAGFGRITAMALDEVRRVLYVCDQPMSRAAAGARFASVIRRVELTPSRSALLPALAVTRVAGSATDDTVGMRVGPISAARFFWHAGGLGVDPRGEVLYVCEDLHGAIRAVNLSSGVVSTAAGPAPPLNQTGFLDALHTNARMRGPRSGVVVAPWGEFIFADTYAHVVRMMMGLLPGERVYPVTPTATTSRTPPETKPVTASRSKSLTGSRSFWADSRSASKSRTRSADSASATDDASRSVSSSLSLSLGRSVSDSGSDASFSLSGSGPTASEGNISESGSLSTDPTMSATITVTPPPTRTPSSSRTVSPPPTRTRIPTLTALATKTRTLTASPSDDDVSYTKPTRSPFSFTQNPTESVSRSPPPTRTTTRSATLSPTRSQTFYLTPVEQLHTLFPPALATATLPAVGGAALLATFAVTPFVVAPGTTDLQLLVLQAQASCTRPAFGTTLDDILYVAAPLARLPGASTVERVVAAVMVPVGFIVLHAFIATVIAPHVCGRRPSHDKASKKSKKKVRRRRHRISIKAAHAACCFPAASLFVAVFFLPGAMFATAESAARPDAAPGTETLGWIVSGLTLFAIVVVSVGRVAEGGTWDPFVFAFESHPIGGCLRRYVLPDGRWRVSSRHWRRFGPLYGHVAQTHPHVSRPVPLIRLVLLALLIGVGAQEPDTWECTVSRMGVTVVSIASALVWLLPATSMRSPISAWFAAMSSGLLAAAPVGTNSAELREEGGRRAALIACIGIPCCAIVQLILALVERLVWANAEAKGASGATSKLLLPPELADRGTAAPGLLSPSDNLAAGGDPVVPINEEVTRSLPFAFRPRAQRAAADGSDSDGPLSPKGQPLPSRSPSPDDDASSSGDDGSPRGDGASPPPQRPRDLGSAAGPASLWSLGLLPSAAGSPGSDAGRARRTGNSDHQGVVVYSGTGAPSTRDGLAGPLTDLRTAPARGRDGAQYWVPETVDGQPRTLGYGRPLLDPCFDHDALSLADEPSGRKGKRKHSKR